MARIKNDEERRKWLDSVVDLKKKELELSEDENGRPLIQAEPQVLVYNDVNLMASAVGAELDEEISNNSIFFPFTYSFVYKGIKFYGFFEERLERYERV